MNEGRISYYGYHFLRKFRTLAFSIPMAVPALAPIQIVVSIPSRGLKAPRV